MRRSFLLFLFAAVLSLSRNTRAAEKTDDALTQQLLAELRALKARVAELEAKVRASPQLASNDSRAEAVPAKSMPPAEREVISSEPDSSHAEHTQMSTPALSFHGYADLNASAINARGGSNSFRLGQADLFITSQLSEKLSFLLETALDSDRDNKPGAEIERILLTYRESPYMNVSVGRYHSAIGYFNGAFHHGRWFQTAANRPFLFEFEDNGGILPIHNVGVDVSGRVPSGALQLNYVAEVGNGRSYQPNAATVQTVTSANNGKSLNFALYANPHFLPGWQFGSSYYRNRVMPDSLRLFKQEIYSAHAVYIRDRVEFLNEGVLMRHSRYSGAPATYVPGFYTQLAYRLGSVSRPYVRFEYLNASTSDPVVGPLLGAATRRQSLTAGYRYDLAEFCAIKFQLERVRRSTLGPTTEGTVQLSFAF